MKGDIALITGAGRRQGIGAAICRSLAREGNHVWFTCLPEVEEDEAGRLAEELHSFGVQARFSPINLADAQAPRQLLEKVEAEWDLPGFWSTMPPIRSGISPLRHWMRMVWMPTMRSISGLHSC